MGILLMGGRLLNGGSCGRLAAALAAAVIASSCASSPAAWNADDFAAYGETQGKETVFAFKTFDTEVNKKMKIVSYACLDSKNTIDILPVEDIASFLERKYGVTVDISEFLRLRSEGLLSANFLTDEGGKERLELASNEMAIDGTSVGGLGGLGLIGLLGGTSWAAVNWSEYREPVKTMDFRYKLERGKSDQMQVFVCLAPVGSYIAVTLRVRDGESDAKGYYKLKAVAEHRVKVPFKSGESDVEVLARTIKDLPNLLESSNN